MLFGGACEAPWQSTPPDRSYGATQPTPTYAPRPATPAAAATATPTEAPTTAPTAVPPPPSGLGVTIQASEYGLLSVLTRPGATCTPSGTLPNGNPVPGLGPAKIADAKGAASWVYNAAATDSSRDGVHRVTCTIGGLSGTDSATFDVSA